MFFPGAEVSARRQAFPVCIFCGDPAMRFYRVSYGTPDKSYRMEPVCRACFNERTAGSVTLAVHDIIRHAARRPAKPLSPVRRYDHENQDE